jgi:hypothetical protein
MKEFYGFSSQEEYDEYTRLMLLLITNDKI